jgi:hypothetical protein
MITVPFPVSISGELEKQICVWVKEHARFGYTSFIIEFDDEELATVFKLRFGI